MIRTMAGHPTAANLLMVVFLVLGVAAIPRLRRATFPDYSKTIVEVRVAYPGGTAEDLEESVCRRIESAIDDVEHVEEIVSEARENVGVVTIEMAESGNPSVFLSDVKAEVEAIDEFPDEAEDPVIRAVARTDKVVSIAVTGPLTARDLKAYCESLKERLQRLDEVSLVEIRGFGTHQIRIEVPTQTLMQYGLSADELALVIQSQSVDRPAGTLSGSDEEVVVRFTDERRRPSEFETIVVVAGASGAEITLGEIAEIREVFDPEENEIRFDGRRAGILEVSKSKTEDSLRTYAAVASLVRRESSAAPPGISLTLTQDQASIVGDRLSMLVRNGWQGLLLVLLVMGAFFGARFSFSVALGLPVAFLGSLFFMQQLGMTLDMLSMVALLLALGLMMDDAIVISENVATEAKKGAGPLEAAVRGTSGVARGVVSSFATTLCVFVPLAFLDGNIGTILLVVPIVLILVLSVSLIEAFLILPSHLAHSLHRTEGRSEGWFRRRFDRLFDGFRERVVGRVVDAAVRWRYLMLAATVAVFLVSLAQLTSGRLKFQALPDIDGDVVLARVLLPPGTPLAKTEAAVEKITSALRRASEAFPQPAGRDLVRHVQVQFNVNTEAKEEGPHVATVSADLLSAEVRECRLDDLLGRWRDEVGDIPDVVSLTFGEPAFGPAGRPIDVRVQGPDLGELKAVSGEIRAWLARHRGVQDLNDDLRPGKSEIRARLRPGAMALGLTAATVASQLRTAIHGAEAGEIRVGAEDYEVDVRQAARDRDGLDDLDRFHVTLPGGKQVPLGAVAHLEDGRGFARIARVDGVRTVTVQGDVDTEVANTAQIMGEVERTLIPELRRRHPDVEISIEGEAEEAQTTRGSMQRGMLLGIIGIFMLLSLQFRSYVEPLVVMVAIPLSLIGVIWGHRIMGVPLTMPSILGFVSLAGVVVNDSILLVEFIRDARRDGADAEVAARTASRARTRAVLITSLTTIAGLIPLMFERSLQAQVLVPMAVSIVFGLLASTTLVLFVVPGLYTMLTDLRLVAPRD